MGLRRVVGLLALVAALAATLFRDWRAGPALAAADDAAQSTARSFLYQGVASCTAAPCHRQEVPPGSKGNEYLTWLTRDPHARAFQDLSNERSRRMTELLGAKQSAEKNPLCLSCHATPVAPARTDGPVSVHDGVGCESCHGAAEKWLHKHYKKGEWPRRGQDQAKLGFVPLQDLTVRAQTCVPCHVGHGDADVNHDLIAAGHPWLHFEFSSYLANYPKHWNEQKNKTDDKDFEARAWLIGQVVSADAALRLLAHRADPARAPSNPWPEFAEYDCFACHHDLEQPWRRTAQHTRGQPGALRWNDWYLSLETVLDQARPPGATVPATLLQELREAMRRPYPDRARVKQSAANAAARWTQDLNAWGRPLDSAQVGRWLQLLDDKANNDLNRASWDQAAQLYLALSAFDEAQDDMQIKPSAPPRKRLLQTLRNQLGFPALFDSPRGYDPSKPRRP